MYYFFYYICNPIIQELDFVTEKELKVLKVFDKQRNTDGCKAENARRFSTDFLTIPEGIMRKIHLTPTPSPLERAGVRSNQREIVNNKFYTL